MVSLADDFIHGLDIEGSLVLDDGGIDQAHSMQRDECDDSHNHCVQME
jgi:hypothetical protein